MRWEVITLAALTGCNAIFGLAPPRPGDDAGDDDADDAGLPDAGPPERLGFIMAESYHYVANNGAGPVVDTYTLGARIGKLSPACVNTQLSAACILLACTTVSDPPPWPDAGTIFYQGMVTSALVPSSDGSYLSTTGTQRLFSDGTTVSINGNGGEVPAFSHTMNAPVTVVVDQDLPNDVHGMMLPRANGLALTWSSGIAGTRVAVIMTPSTGSDTLACAWPANDGGGSIDANVLVQLPAGNAAFAAVTDAIDYIDAGDYHLQLLLRGGVLDRTGDRTVGTITLQ